MWVYIWIVSIVGLVICDVQVGVLILARGGSKGVPLKNIKKVGGVSLLSRAIRTAKAAGLNDITVSTDHLLIALEAIKENVTILRRTAITASDWAPSIWGSSEFLAQRPDITVLVLLQATSPFIKPDQLLNALRKINDPTPFDCVFSATRSFNLRWEERDGRYYPINFELLNRARRQDRKGEFLENGAFYISRRWLIEAGYFQNHKYLVSFKGT